MNQKKVKVASNQGAWLNERIRNSQHWLFTGLKWAVSPIPVCVMRKKLVDLGIQQQTESPPAASLDDKTKWNRYYFQMQFSSTWVIWFAFSRKALWQLHQMQSSTSLSWSPNAIATYQWFLSLWCVQSPELNLSQSYKGYYYFNLET